MSRQEKRWWLVRLQTGETITNHLVYVKSIEDFKKLMSKDIEIIYYGQASWQTMNYLTGCEIVNLVRLHNYANGPLKFIRNQQEVILHPA